MKSRPAWGRTGKFLACEHDNVKPDGVILGKALGGGLLPLSVMVGTEDLMQVFTPGDHGSTFGGNPPGGVSWPGRARRSFR
jgi:ornithine--oxo-acid transaminase